VCSSDLWLNRLKTSAGSTVLIDSSYTRDDAGRIKAIDSIDSNGTTVPKDTWSYGLDFRDRLTRATNNGTTNLTETFTYSANNNLQSRTRGSYDSITYGGLTPSGVALPHAIKRALGVTYTYDENGNTLTDSMPSGATRTFTWSGANQLKSVKVTEGTTNSVTRLVYGADGARVKKVPPSDEFSLYPSADVEITKKTSGWEYTRYPYMDVKVVLSGGVNRTFYLHRDHLSSVRVVTNANAVVTEETRYAAYGEPSNKSMVSQKNYIGERYDPETGLLYLNARYMNPYTGKFVPEDKTYANAAGQRRH
jgi:RHS repeat-associated protein